MEIDFEEFAKNVEDDGKFGELGDDGKVLEEDDENDDEVGDIVGDLDFEDSHKDLFFEIDRGKQRHTSAMVSNSDLFKGLDEIKKKGQDKFNDLDERLKAIVGDSD